MWRPYKNTTMTHGECIDKFDDDVLMQFTGLLDKNGKEIYEGDILRGLGKVYFHQGKFCVEYGEEWGWISKNAEIIGNIYENPELLTNSNK